MASRILYLLVLLILVFWAPWWLAIIFSLLGMIYYKNFYEVIIPALFFDFLYVAGPPWLTIFGLAVVYLLEDFKAMIITA